MQHVSVFIVCGSLSRISRGCTRSQQHLPFGATAQFTQLQLGVNAPSPGHCNVSSASQHCIILPEHTHTPYL